MRLFIVEKLVNGVIVLELRGRLTLGPETEALREKIRRLTESGYTRIVVDLGEVTYIDSVGLSTFVGAYATVRKAGGSLKLASLTKRVRDLIQITRLSMVFDVYDSKEAALKSFQAPAG